MYFPSPELNPSQTFEIILPNRIQKSKNQNLKCRPPPLFFWGKGGGATDSPARRRGLGRNPRGLRLSFLKKSAANYFLNQKDIVPLTLHRQYLSDDLLHLQSNGVSRPIEIQLYYSERRLSLSNDLANHQISNFPRRQSNLSQFQIGHHLKFRDHDFVLS